uniref:Mediator of RNA polymerase II transcription subunit 24 n=1 Tax=Timema douglasi TaxID=61478 RepID=A0A7R8ZGF9_TIMDO|nr:unnamed protein product [Timema douglasi]
MVAFYKVTRPQAGIDDEDDDDDDGDDNGDDNDDGEGYSMARLHCEIMRACLISLNDVLGTSEESGWGAFVFLKIPYILRQLHHTTSGEDKSVEFSQDIVDSFELLLQYTPLLDIMDARCSCNIVECLLRELAKVGLVTEPLVTLYSSKRESTSPVVPRLEQAQSQSASIPKVIIRAEPTLARILKTLDADYVKVQVRTANITDSDCDMSSPWQIMYYMYLKRMSVALARSGFNCGTSPPVFRKEN